MKIDEITKFSQRIKEKYKTSAFYRKDINLFKIACNYITFNEEVETHEFSEIYQFITENFEHQIIRTKSQGVSILKQNVSKVGQYFVANEKTQIDIVIQLYDEKYIEQTIKTHEPAYEYVRFIISNGVQKKGKKTLTGRYAYNIIKSVCDKFNFDLNQLAVNNGEKVKEEIKAPYIEVFAGAKVDKTYTNVHHLDFNSAYWSNIVKEYPQLKDIMKYIYEKRHDNDDYFKNALAMSQGYFQSEYCQINGYKYALANLAKAGVNGTFNDVADMIDKLVNNGRKVLLLNTDGIWYQGDIYHDENEGKDISQYKNDHINCTFRMKSKGCYEFIENGIYHPVFRGTSSYEKIVPKSNWQWGDIYKGKTVEYYWDNKLGLIKKEN